MSNSTGAPSAAKPTRFSAVETAQVQGTSPALGYRLVILTAAATTLLIGDAVYLTTTAGVVDKSTTNANYKGMVGIVVGGKSFDSEGRVAFDSGLVGSTAATSGQSVIVAIDGSIVYGIVGTAITAGQVLAASAATAGRLIPDPTGKPLFATALEASATGGNPVKLFLRFAQST